MFLQPCPAGLYCPTGTSYVPSLNNNACPAGQYCLEATALPLNCPAGTYNPNSGSSSCITCPAGSFCTEGVANITGII